MRNQRSVVRLTILTLAVAILITLNGLLAPRLDQAAHASINASLTETAAALPASARANGKIAFASYQGGTSQVYTMNSDGTDRTQLTFEIKGAWGPAWSPDGARIAFVRGTPDLNSEILVMNADGSNQRRLSQASHANSPTWSPDGTRIAFDAVTGNRSRQQDLYVMNADGTDEKLIANLSGYAFPAWSLAWSPDGSRLAMSGFFGAILLINIDGSNQTRLTKPPAAEGYDIHPAWSPDGSKIAFTRVTDCDFNDCYTPHVWVINADGSNQRMLTGEEILGANAEWSPDGQKIVFSAWEELWVMNSDGSGIINITNTNDKNEWAASWQPVVLVAPPNEIDEAQFFVRQHYRDFLNREPDSDGQSFWANVILSCRGDAQCIDAKRISVSAAYFLSIEFQQTGYLVYRIYKASYGNLPGAPVPITRSEFSPDTQQIGQGVIVNQAGWEQMLESNKQAFTSDFVQRSRFSSAYPSTMTAAEFVDKLNSNAGNPLSQSEHDQLVSDLSSGAKTRAQVLRAVAEDPDLVSAEFNRAFVLMQYFGYLQRNPTETPEPGLNYDGYNFWLNKLNNFNGNFQNAEMVRAFITSAEYRRRFGP